MFKTGSSLAAWDLGNSTLFQDLDIRISDSKEEEEAMLSYDYHKPDTLKEALALMTQYKNEAVFIAGGTDVMVQIEQKKLKPKGTHIATQRGGPEAQ